MNDTIKRLRELDDAWMWEQGFGFHEPLELHMLSPNGITREVIAKFESERELKLAIAARNALPFLLDVVEAAKNFRNSVPDAEIEIAEDAWGYTNYLLVKENATALDDALARLKELENDH